jgi:hypothetical protein
VIVGIQIFEMPDICDDFVKQGKPPMNKHIDIGSFVVAIITLALFVVALFAKGLTHDLLLEAGVFLISVKIIAMAYKNSVAVHRMDGKLDAIIKELERSNAVSADTVCGPQVWTDSPAQPDTVNGDGNGR